MGKEIISTDKAPKPAGAYSQAIKSQGFIFVAGQIPFDTTEDKLITTGVHKETRVVIGNIEAILEAAGSSLDKVVQTTVYLKNIEDIKFVNEVYEEMFGDTPPARAVVEVSRLPKDINIEIDAVAEA